MEMTGEQLIPLPQQRVWEALNDPEILKACIPGCETIDKVADDEYAVAMSRIGRAGEGALQRQAEAVGSESTQFLLASRSRARAAQPDSAKAAHMSISCPRAARRDCAIRANASVGGQLAQVGSRLIDGVARKMADDFFVRFNQTVAPPAAAAPSSVASVAADDDGIPPGVKYPTMPTWVWIAAGVVVAALFFMRFARTRATANAETQRAQRTQRKP